MRFIVYANPCSYKIGQKKSIQNFNYRMNFSRTSRVVGAINASYKREDEIANAYEPPVTKVVKSVSSKPIA
jgi:hypothetical protein